MNSKIGIIIQARMGSTRLPNKILLPFYNGKGCLELLIERLIEHIHIPIIIATSTSENDNEIEQLATRLNVKYFRGDEQDVLKRFIDCAEFYNLETIIRVCSDNPFLDIKSIEKLINSNIECDYESFWINNSPSIKTHFGFWSEKVKKSALLKANALTQNSFYHEHVTNYIYGNPDEFTIYFNEINNQLLAQLPLRLTLDTLVDFNTLSSLYKKMMENNREFSIESILQEISSNKDYLISMENEIINNSK